MNRASHGCICRAALLGALLLGGVALCRGGASIVRAQPTADEPGAASDSLAPEEAAAVPSRAARWRKRRRQKADAIEPPEPSLIRQALSVVSNVGGAVVPHRLILSIPQLEIAGFHPVFGGLEGDAGTTAGVLYEPPFWHGPRRLAEAEVLASLRRYYGAGVRVGGRAGPYVGYTYARYQHRPRENFYGLGSGSKTDAEAEFRLDQGVVGGLVGRLLGPSALVGGHLSYQVNRYGPAGGSAPQVAGQFGPAVPGVGTDLDYLMIGGFFELDIRDAPYDRAFGHRFAPTEPRLRGVSLDASRGFYLATEVTHNLNVGHRQLSFTRFTLDVREFLPIQEGLLHGFSFRQFASVTHSGGNRVPFYRLQSIGGARSLRGYASDRFRDRNVLLANAEVRCQVWHWLDMAVFADAGRVFRDAGAMMGAPRLGYGLGFRVKNKGKTLGRVDMAYGSEGWRLHMDLGSLF